MEMKREASTKEKILKTAAKLFSEKGFDKVSTREISRELGMNSAAIYYYFPSKVDLLRSLYDYYRQNLRRANPDLAVLLRLAETDPPHEVLLKSVYYFEDYDRVTMNYIISIAAREICADSDSEALIREMIFENIAGILRPLLNHMLALGKIESLDVDNFLRVVSCYCFSAAALSNSALNQTPDNYIAGMSYLFSMIKAVEDAGDQ